MLAAAGLAEIAFGHRAAAFTRLDDADSNIVHCLDQTDEKKIKTGARVRAVFSESRTGAYFHDIEYFSMVRDA